MSTTRVTDYIANRLYKEGVKDVFMVTGGGMMFLSDGVVKHPHLRFVCNHHEQASAMAAVGYAKYTGGLGVAYLSTGCGATNAITGLLHAWQDNTPCVFISGQVKRRETVRNSGLPLRQIGTQEADIISVVESLSKYAVMVNEPNDIAYHLEKALYLARTGRPGPVWIDVPMDVQSAVIDVKKLRRFDPKELKKEYKEIPTTSEIAMLKKLIEGAKRPVIVAGQGIRLSGARDVFITFCDTYKIPVVSPYLGVAIVPTAHPSYIGVIGTKASRSGNFAVQNADLVISLGSRLSVTSTGHEYHLFARHAKVVAIDIDPVEHKKNTVRIDHFINADVKEVLKRLTLKKNLGIDEWAKTCLMWKKKYPVCLPEHRISKKGISFYHFVDTLSKNMSNDAVVVSDAGSAFYVTTQTINIKGKQRYITSGGQAEMGYTIPATIGASVARGRKEVFGITGDGSFQMNIQELQTIVHYNLPIKTFVWNNNGYLSIRTTQKKFFDGRLIGAHPESGVSVPSFKKIAYAYGIKYFRLTSSKTLAHDLKKVLAYKGPVICEVMCIEHDAVLPAVSSYKKEDGTIVSKPIEDMFPFLDRDEFLKNMIVPPVKE